jgi:hypothetical protein
MMKKIALGIGMIGFAMVASSCGGDHAGHDDHMGNQEEKANKSAAYQATYSFPSGQPEAGTAAQLGIVIQDASGTAVEQFEISHEKLLHLIAVNEDLSWFSHIHPEYKDDGQFTIETTFPAGGAYKLFADFVPEGGEATTASGVVNIQGDTVPNQDLVADVKNIESRVLKSVDGKEVELAMKAATLTAGEDVSLVFTIRDAKDQTPITNLQPYLGAIGHVVIISADAEEYVHVHPMNGKATGPEAVFHTVFPKPGLYKIWGQFQHEDRVFTVDYVVEIQN